MQLRKIFVTIIWPVGGGPVAGAISRPTDQGSEIKFTINNFGFGVDGKFTGLQGSIDFDPQHVVAGAF